ncbi:hypothetical protein Q7P35_011088 [Cladosporium inversicolor]
MQFPTVFLIAATIASAAAAPTGGSSSRDSPAKVQHEGGKWKPGWGGAANKDKYICSTSGLINILNCDNILDGNTVNVDLGSLLSGLGL